MNYLEFLHRASDLLRTTAGSDACNLPDWERIYAGADFADERVPDFDDMVGIRRDWFTVQISMRGLYSRCVEYGWERVEMDVRASFGNGSVRKVNDYMARLSGEDRRLYEALRKLRGELARENRVAPFCVFTNRTLYELCLQQPRTIAEMKKVYGIGDRKAAKYGVRVLTELYDLTAGKMVEEEMRAGQRSEEGVVEDGRLPEAGRREIDKSLRLLEPGRNGIDEDTRLLEPSGGGVDGDTRLPELGEGEIDGDTRLLEPSGGGIDENNRPREMDEGDVAESECLSAMIGGAINGEIGQDGHVREPADEGAEEDEYMKEDEYPEEDENTEEDEYAEEDEYSWEDEEDEENGEDCRRESRNFRIEPVDWFEDDDLDASLPVENLIDPPIKIRGLRRPITVRGGGGLLAMETTDDF